MHKTNRGFSLIELMIVVAILAIVVSWGYSSYRDTVLKSRRSEGMGDLLILADSMERYFSNRGTYVGASLGSSANAVHPLNSESGYYRYSFSPNPSTLMFTALAVPQGRQVDDKCGTLSYDSQGFKSASGSGTCW